MVSNSCLAGGAQPSVHVCLDGLARYGDQGVTRSLQIIEKVADEPVSRILKTSIENT